MNKLTISIAFPGNKSDVAEPVLVTASASG